MRPWILQLGPLFIPSDGRQELQAISDVMTPAQYLDKVWDNREEENPRDDKSLCNWPMVSGPQEAEPPQTVPAKVPPEPRKIMRFRPGQIEAEYVMQKIDRKTGAWAG